MALSCSCLLAGTVEVPEPVPDFALRAAEVYRLEVGAAFFVAFYIATLTFLLALSGRGFAEIGTTGLKVSKVLKRSEVGLRQQRDIDRHTRAMLQDCDAHIKDLERRLAAQEKRLDRIHAKR